MRARSASLPRLAIAALCGLAAIGAPSHPLAADELVDGTLVSATHNIRFTPPRKDWRLTTRAPYPGILMWMQHVPSTAIMLFTAQTVTEAQTCAFPTACQQGTLAQAFACALADDLKRRGYQPTGINVAGVAWFDFNTKQRFARQAVVAYDDAVFTLVLAAESADQRLMLSRVFDRAIKTIVPNDDLTHADLMVDPLRCSAPPPPTQAQPTKPTAAAPPAAAPQP